ncbi:MAG: hypothetical protein HC873_03550 [Leptolyngbyaceae cyanobacterium SL_1_1]|nr:hypothetical protein [Leptolyngbyaceae cyanobacterium SL_1_1]
MSITPQQLIRPSFLGGVAVLGSLLIGCSQTESATTEPLSFEAQLADYLTAEGDKMYGAYWCPHCAEQKERFGNAVDRIPYVECDPKGEEAQPEICQAKGIKGYPTWEIKGEIYMGVQSVEELATLSGFEPKPR